jgi:hypothetical protein
MSCATRLDAAILAEYWLGTLGATEEESLEEHLFACEECGTRLDWVIALAEELRAVTRDGSLMTVVSETFLKRAEEEGLRVRQYAPPAGGSVQCTVTAQDDLLVGRLAAKLGTARKIDLSLCDPGGVEQFRLRDIPFEPAASSVLWQQSITFAKAAPTSTMVARLIGVDESGSESLLGEYTFCHTRTLPGPGAW